MHVIRIAICDDEQCVIPQMEIIVDKFFKTHCVDCYIQVYQSSENLQYDLHDGIFYNLFLLDIEMPGVDGWYWQKKFIILLQPLKLYLSLLILNMLSPLMSILYFVTFLKR